MRTFLLTEAANGSWIIEDKGSGVLHAFTCQRDLMDELRALTVDTSPAPGSVNDDVPPTQGAPDMAARFAPTKLQKTLGIIR